MLGHMQKMDDLPTVPGEEGGTFIIADSLHGVVYGPFQWAGLQFCSDTPIQGVRKIPGSKEVYKVLLPWKIYFREAYIETPGFWPLPWTEAAKILGLDPRTSWSNLRKLQVPDHLFEVLCDRLDLGNLNQGAGADPDIIMEDNEYPEWEDWMTDPVKVAVKIFGVDPERAEEEVENWSRD